MSDCSCANCECKRQEDPYLEHVTETKIRYILKFNDVVDDRHRPRSILRRLFNRKVDVTMTPTSLTVAELSDMLDMLASNDIHNVDIYMNVDDVLVAGLPS